ncbi:MAG TPA: hypothetical protein VFY46_01265, partial [Acidimicrobiia bacterium]|nr:hypothetical protein [Acidimicrobiia bacterium]
MNRPELRPLAVGEIVDAAIKLIRANARVLFTISAIVLIPLGLIQGFVSALGLPDAFATFDALPVDGSITQEQFNDLLSTLGQLLLLALATAIITGLGS